MSRTEVEQPRQEHVTGPATPALRSTRRGRGVLGVVVIAALAVGAIGLGVAALDAGGGKAGPVLEPSAEALVAQDFLSAYTTFDHEQVALHLAGDATMPEDWARDLRRYEAWHAVFLVEPCETLSTSAAGTNITCAFDHHALGTDELGRDPFGLNVFTLRVDDGKVEHFEATYNAGSNGFLDQLDAVGAWVRAHHPGDWGFMETHEDVSDADLPRWLRLWDARLTEYVAATAGGGA